MQISTLEECAMNQLFSYPIETSLRRGCFDCFVFYVKLHQTFSSKSADAILITRITVFMKLGKTFSS